MGYVHNDRCLTKVGKDEPIFVLRAQDATAPSQVLRWAARVAEVGPIAPLDKIREACELAIEMLEWQFQHKEKVKWPD